MNPKTKSLIIIPFLLVGVVAATIACAGSQLKQSSEILSNGNFVQGADKWVLEEAGAKGKVEFVNEGPEGSPAMKLTVVSVGDQSWRLQTYQPNLKISKSKRYNLTFWVKAKQETVITVNCMQNHEPWEHHGAAIEMPITTEWAQKTFAFDGPWDDDNARLTFTNLGTVPGQAYWFAKCSLTESPKEPHGSTSKPLPVVPVKPGALKGLRVVGNKIQDASGKVVRLQGVNIPSLEWDPKGDHFMQSLDAAMGSWNSKIIRIPLTQDLWYGYYKGERNPDGGQAYRKLIDSVVKRIADKKGIALLDLHWSNGGKWGQYVGQHSMPDDLSLVFWKDFAKRYANHPSVMFDLYNEPHDVSWEVWKNGGMVEERNSDPSRGLHLTYHTPGMQALLDGVRSTGAKNIVVVGGLDWAYDLRGVVNGYALSDPNGNGIVYATHIYPWKKDWAANVTPAIAKYPVFVGEVGTKPWEPGHPAHENVYTENWAPEVIEYINKHELSWTAWCFHPSANPCLITGWDYKPTPYWGTYVKEALSKASLSSNKDVVVVWDGEGANKGSGWTNPTSSTFEPAMGDAHSGNTALEFKFNANHIWIGCGFDWFEWKTGNDIGTDTRTMTNLTFWIKSKGRTGDLEVQLLCNGDVLDTPEHHAAKVKVRKYCPDLLDGKWHKVSVPLVDMTQPPGYDPRIVSQIDFGFWSEGQANGSFLVDDIAFESGK